MSSASSSATPRPGTERPASALSADLLKILRCPVSGSPLRQEGDQLISTSDETLRYAIERGVPTLLAPR
ncbi:hypothetical protein [Nesterenkonia halotolerans]|uniref:Uncharacterized protein YbaR (Trm112 family) n=1 Tax=Nesterenkonia halotolerans TaxID=225325 RepID=A0ABR9J9P5_9MICC|nr:hypothetical protein [Nesterenkonia halotolerans]MBE1515720.1 uncharacterized protein YbaR (Trm112 family) [Nesterenkonia halotolerans]